MIILTHNTGKRKSIFSKFPIRIKGSHSVFDGTLLNKPISRCPSCGLSVMEAMTDSGKKILVSQISERDKMLCVHFLVCHLHKNKE
jgi:hypothetical protein